MNIELRDRIERRPITTLVPYARNSRTHSDEQVAQIAASMKEWGWTNPVLVDEGGGIIAGHGRVLAARRLGLQEVPVIVAAGWTDAQRRAYVIADNKLALNAGWDDELLRLELTDLQELGFDLDAVGFSDEELDALLEPEIEQVEGNTDEDETPEPPEEPTTKPGDVWILGKHRVVCGSSTDANAWQKLGDVSDAVTFTSPPYGAGNVAKLRDHYIPGKSKRESFYETHADTAEDWPNLMDAWSGLAIASTSAVICNVQLLADNKRALMKWSSKLADHLVDVVIWDKANGAPQMQANVLTNAWEFVYIFSREIEASRSIPFAKFHGNKANIVRLDPRGKNDFASVHRAVMPIALAEWAIELCETARKFVDPFGGTGTTLIACEKHGRFARLIELDPKYCDVIVKRWQDFTGKRATLEADGRTFDEVAEARA